LNLQEEIAVLYWTHEINTFKEHQYSNAQPFFLLFVTLLELPTSLELDFMKLSGVLEGVRDRTYRTHGINRQDRTRIVDNEPRGKIIAKLVTRVPGVEPDLLLVFVMGSPSQ